ncbi:MAG: PEP-CTERM sorting domain-containing protein [Myxococcota bacterium]|jgi:hypothetical protein|nr:PEP-CTERM sorting domain-containing protein [Myxococcota bacterium]MDP6244312.1 PEP-CTERM sorting domain-containing protein [Myxococcota bacterium]MDP7074249.1 PEP-CTERM sorting domain-containing protein [Myxococcota bacterium]MDP7300964.1 PEP-CTERM sorting domain-containing protein [Myxococcota bacterium]MDP7432243.1 PEP-CTERM sorting domain-containing protein [Myxococcota bacterium]
MRLLRVLWGIVALLGVGFASSAQAGSISTTGASEDWPTEILSGNGKLEFSHFHVYGIDVSDLNWEILEDGLSVAPNKSTEGHWDSDFFMISYKVTAVEDSMPISEAWLKLDSSTGDHGFSKVLAIEKLLGVGNGFPPEFDSLHTYDIRNKYKKATDHTTFDTPRDSVYVTNKILLFSVGSTATWIGGENRFSVVPEPTTAGLLGLGLTGLFILGRHRN